MDRRLPSSPTLATLCVLAFAAPAAAQDDAAPAAPQAGAGVAAETLRAEVVGADGAAHGTVEIRQAPVGVLVTLDLTGLPPGTHGLHFHTVGACEPPFESAGPHFDPAESPHGFLAEGGPHAGDLPNLQVGPDGAARVETFVTLLSLRPEEQAILLDADGSALIVHASADDYTSQPSGESGARLACAVLSR
jgi:Cu-Zn family superoxide dismutase